MLRSRISLFSSTTLYTVVCRFSAHLLLILGVSFAYGEDLPNLGGKGNLYFMGMDRIDVLEAIHSLANELVELCPPSECAIIGIGKSPSSILTYMQVRGIRSNINVPLTLSPVVGVKDFNINRANSLALIPPGSEIESKTIDYLTASVSHVLEDPKIKRVMIVDYLNSGASSELAFNLMKKAVLMVKPNLQKVEIAGLTPKDYSYPQLSIEFTRIDVDWRISGSFSWRTSDAVAPYRVRYTPASIAAGHAPMPNPKYYEYVQVLERFAEMKSANIARDCRSGLK